METFSTLFFLFYFNRLFATLLSYAIRAYTWHYYRVYVDIQALQISFLGGRIFFKGFRYHGENETILAHSGYITYRYWLRSARETDLSRNGGLSLNHEATERENFKAEKDDSDQCAGEDERGGLKEVNRLPCRIEATILGAEWFVYNRSAAYESILSGFGNTSRNHGDDGGRAKGKNEMSATDNKYEGHNLDQPPPSAYSGSTSAPDPPATRPSDDSISERSSSDSASNRQRPNAVPVSCLLSFFPIWVNFRKGAMVLGNENTRCVMTAQFEDATGRVDAGSAGPLDLYRQIFDLNFIRPKVQLRPNPDFKQPQLSAGNALHPSDDDNKGQSRRRNLHLKYRHHRRKVWDSVRDLIPYFQRSVESFHASGQGEKTSTPQNKEIPGSSRWLGLTRYLDENVHDEHEGWDAVEYARFSTLIDCPSVSFNYYWDIPGKVETIPNRQTSSRDTNNINGANPPEWGLHLGVRGGTINYGPWADRERAHLQSVFFPNSYRDSEQNSPIEVGQPRQSTMFKLTVDIEHETTLRIPIREPSKDWQWKGRADVVRGASKTQKEQNKRNSRNNDPEKSSHGPDIRPFGWLSFRIDADSSVNYTMDMVASTPLYQNHLDLDLRGSRVTTSVNHALLWQSGRQVISCDLSNPLKWDSMRTWSFDVKSYDLDLFLLRDHMFLLTDLISDWMTGPPADFYTFVPFQYKFNLSFANVRLFMNVNDANIINNPSDTNDNSFIVIKGETISSDVVISSINLNPSRNSVPFTVDLENGSIELLTPIWNTQHTFMQDKSVASLKRMELKGSYNYNVATSPALTDRLDIDILGISPNLYLYGFLIRYFILIKENYFGENMHFKTLEEYQTMLNPEASTLENGASAHLAKSNDLDVHIHVHGDNPIVLIPANLYENHNCLRIEAIGLDTDVRFTNYYMDLETSVTPLELFIDSVNNGSRTISNSQLFIDGLSVYGHRLFGLPPTEPTYVCNWDFKIGSIIGQSTSESLKVMISALKYLAFTIDDEENALPPHNPVVLHDVTFLRARVGAIRLWILVDKTALLASSGALDIDFNDLAGSRFSERLNVVIPDLTFSAVDSKSARRLRDAPGKPVKTYAYINTSVNLKMVERKSDFVANRTLQQQHIRTQDQRSNRTPWLLRDSDHDNITVAQLTGRGSNPPPMPVPSMPEPIRLVDELYQGFSDHPSSDFSETSSNTGSFSSQYSLPSDVEKSRPNSRLAARSAISSLPATPVPFPEDDLAFQSRTVGQTTSLRYSGKTEGDKGPKSTTRLSSAWGPPRYYFQSIQPDTNEVPSLPSRSRLYERRVREQEDNIDVLSGTEYENATYVNFLFALDSGITGFFSADSLQSIISLVDDLQPQHPLDVIDNLQSSIISDILSHEKSKKIKSNTLKSFSFRLPVSHLRIISTSVEQDDEVPAEFRDQYDLVTTGVRATCRERVNKCSNPDIGPSTSSLTMYATTDSISLSATGEKLDAVGQRGLFNARCDNMAFWLVSGDIWRSRGEVENFEGVTSSKSVEDVALLVQRTTKLVELIYLPIRRISEESTKRLRSLVYRLTEKGSETPDSLFLTRPSYVLRTAGEHLRLNDSWKIISRLRNIYRSLPDGEHMELDNFCLRNNLPLPENARTIVLSSFDRWRTWDLAHVRKSYVMKHIWGKLNRGSLEPSVPEIKAFSLYVKNLKLSLDPGPKENSILVGNISTSVRIGVNREAGVSTVKPLQRSIDVRSNCTNASVLLNWEICELIEKLPSLLSKATQPSPKSSQLSPENVMLTTLGKLHFVFVIDHGSTIVNAINLRIAFTGRGIKGSLLRQNSDMVSPVSTCIVGCDAGSSELFTTRASSLMVCKLQYPNIFFSHSSQTNNSRIENDWKLAAACKRLRYDMKEDPLGILHVANSVVQDEVKYLSGLVSTIKSVGPQEAAQQSQNDCHNFYIATFLEDYRLSLSLLPSLSYEISGEVARLSVSPTTGSKLGVDFDIKDNRHTFWSGKKGKKGLISTLNIPPINGRIIVHLSSSRSMLDIDSTVEKTRVDAGSVRNLLSTINGPEISHLVSELSESAKIIRARLDHIVFQGEGPPQLKMESGNQELIYKVRLTFAGIVVHSTAPSLRHKDRSADMDLSFGMIQFHMENVNPAGIILEFPEFDSRLSQISLNLKRHGAVETQSSGDLVVDVQVFGGSKVNERGDLVRSYHLVVSSLQINLFAETASIMVDVAAHLQERLKSLELSHELKRLRKLKLVKSHEALPSSQMPVIETHDGTQTKGIFDAIYSVELNNFQTTWITPAPSAISCIRDPEDLVFSIHRVEFATRRENAAHLRIEKMQLQMVPMNEDKTKRSPNSALLPEAVFNVAYFTNGSGHRLAFQAAGKALDIRMTPEFILPASLVQDSIASASGKLREANNIWSANVSPNQEKPSSSTNNFRLASLLVDADFAGAVLSLQGKNRDEPPNVTSPGARTTRSQGGGRYGQFIETDTVTTATLRAPGIALKVQFEDSGVEEPTLNAEIKVDASTNALYPTVVPLISQVTSSIKEVVGDPESEDSRKGMDQSFQNLASQGKVIGDNDPESILGRCKLNVGLLICKQEFSLSCQPVARVAATASFGNSYMTVNTVQSSEHKRFFAILVAFNYLEASVKHVYSSESTASFAVDSIVMSLMNSKHVSTSSGISAILKVSPTNVQINAKQVQDFLLFREIWVPPDESPVQSTSAQGSSEEQDYVVQRYQQMATAGAFPWNSVIAVEKLQVQIDLGQTLGKTELAMTDLWLSSKKSSDWEQNLCIGLDNIAVTSKGRLDGLVELRQFKVRTSIEWPINEPTPSRTPLIQASIAFDRLQSKVSFEYQPFLVADISSFDFIMYNVRTGLASRKDRLVSILDGDKFQVFCTSLTASQSLALYQTIQRLTQDKQAAYDASLKEIERFLRRKSTAVTDEIPQPSMPSDKSDKDDLKMPISLHTDVVVNLRAINVGVFPSTFRDNQIFKLEAFAAEARFSVSPQEGRIHSGLGLTLGQLRVALSSVNRPQSPVSEEQTIDRIILRAAGSRGGTILKVPRVLASMRTWQSPESNHIDYIFQSFFEGKVDVGWNYSRISFIRGMWSHHSRALAARLGKPLPQSAVQITREQRDGENGEYNGQEKITAVVNVPQSRYSYNAMEPPVIETPQLRDMGEATPPLEWIGLHRDKLPNITHQIIIVTLMEIAKDVEDAYSKILGS